MAEPVASRSLAWALRHLVRAATWLLGVVVGLLCGIGVVYLGVLGTLLVAGLSTGLGLLVVSASRARPDAPVPGLVATPERVLALSVGSLAITGWVHVGSIRWGIAVVLAVLGGLVQERFPLGRALAAAGRTIDRQLRARDLADLLGRLPTDVLLAEWDGTGRAVALHPGLRAEGDLVRLRALLLDELERRDADGFAAWEQAWRRAAGRPPCAPEGFLDEGGDPRA